MNSFNFRKEIKFILLWSTALNLIVYGISVVIIGINISVLAGLVLGTVILIINMIHLHKSILRITAFGGKGKNPMMKGYLFRSLIVCIGIFISFRVDFINVLGALLPLFYPKVIYTIHSIIKGGK